MVKEHEKISQKRNVTDQYLNKCSTVYYINQIYAK